MLIYLDLKQKKLKQKILRNKQFITNNNYFNTVRIKLFKRTGAVQHDKMNRIHRKVQSIEVRGANRKEVRNIFKYAWLFL